jgi:hypothetical protein
VTGGTDAQIRLDLDTLSIETCVEIIVAAVRSELQRTEVGEGAARTDS